jgi:hypothetical protein
MLRSTGQSGMDSIPVARCETSGWMPESLHRSGEAPKYPVRRINQTQPTPSDKICRGFAAPVPAADNPRRFRSGYPYYIRSGLTGSA